MMDDYAELLLAQMTIYKKMHDAFLNKDYMNAYFLTCDNTEIAQQLEDLSQTLARKYGNKN
jgi:hypothetical protein